MELASDKGVEMGIGGIPSELWISLCSESEDTSQPIRRPLQLLGPSPRSLGFWTPFLWVPVQSSRDALWLRPGSPRVPARSIRLGRCCRLPWELPSCQKRISKSNSLRVSLRETKGQRLPLELPLGCEAPCLASIPGDLTAGLRRPGSLAPSWGTLRGHPSSKLPEEPGEAFSPETVPLPTFCPHPAFLPSPGWTPRSLGTQAPTHLSISRALPSSSCKRRGKQNKQRVKSKLEVKTQENPRAWDVTMKFSTACGGGLEGAS